MDGAARGGRGARDQGARCACRAAMTGSRADAGADVVGLDADLIDRWPLPLDEDGDKHVRGTVLVIGGSPVTPGAVILAGIAALRMGAGRLQIATAEGPASAVAVAVPE